MLRWVLRAGAGLLTTSVLVCAAAGPAAAADTGGRTVDTARIDRFVADFVATQGIAGVSVALVRDGEILHTQGYGHGSDGPVTARTPVPVASLSKSMTAMAVMRLVEADKVDLDAPVRDYVPEFDPDDPRAEGITVRRLLDQTSGLSSGLLSPDRRAKESLREAVASLSSMGPTADPGTRHAYFNGNYWLLARLVEEVSGAPFDTHLDASVFAPLGMDDSATFADAAEAAAAAEGGHASAYGTSIARPEPSDFATGAGGVVSTADDMARWLAPYTSEGRTADGELFVSAATIDAMLTPSAPEGKYALGWRDGTPEGDARPRMSHDGNSLTSNAYQGIYREDGYGVAVLSNTFTLPTESAYPIAEGIIDIAEGATPESPSAVNAVSDYVLAALTALTAALGVRRLVRATAWAERFGGRSTWRLAARLLPRLLPSALACAFVALVIASGADAGFLGLWFIWPALGVWALVAVVANLSTFAIRLHTLRRTRAAARDQP